MKSPTFYHQMIQRDASARPGTATLCGFSIWQRIQDTLQDRCKYCTYLILCIYIYMYICIVMYIMYIYIIDNLGIDI